MSVTIDLRDVSRHPSLEQNDYIQSLWRQAVKSDFASIDSYIHNIPINEYTLTCLKRGKWIHDDAINANMALLQQHVYLNE